MELKMLATIVALLILCVAAAAPNDRAVIVSYPQNTPDEVLGRAKAAILKAGGVVTHEYHLIKAFSCEASREVLETVQAFADFPVTIEDDQQMHAAANGF